MINKKQYLWFSLSGIIIILDQLSKIAADKCLSFHIAKPVIPFFNLTLTYNKGAAFSFLNDAGGWQRWFFIGLSIVVSIILINWLIKLTHKERWTSLSLSLILGGAIGNLVDRVIYGHVIDFLDVYYKQYHWPTFNVADSAISVGAVILLFTVFFTDESSATDRQQNS